MIHPEAREISVAHVFARLAGAGVVVSIGLAVVGYYPTRAAAGPDGITAMLAGLAAALLGAWGGLVLMVSALRVTPREQVSRILGGLGVRFAVTVVLAVCLALSGWVAARPAVLWIAVAQLVILASDTWLLAGQLQRQGRAIP